MLDSRYEVFVLISYQHYVISIMAKHLQFGLICSKDIVPEVLWLLQKQLCWKSALRLWQDCIKSHENFFPPHCMLSYVFHKNKDILNNHKASLFGSWYMTPPPTCPAEYKNVYTGSCLCKCLCTCVWTAWCGLFNQWRLNGWLVTWQIGYLIPPQCST